MPTIKIYLIDDDEISNYLSTSLIKKIMPEVDVRQFKNGLEALEFFKDLAPVRIEPGEQALVLLDIRMPVMNGFEFLEEISESGVNLMESMEVFMLTSSDNPKDLEKAKSYGVNGYLNKPLSEADLKDFLKVKN